MADLQPERLREDIAAKPALLRSFVDDDARTVWSAASRASRLLLLGMGSSYFACCVVARRMRERGVVAVAERASVDASWPAERGDVVVAVSAGGTSVETRRAAERYQDTAATLVALTNRPGSALAALAGEEVSMAAGEEVSGVSVRSFLATTVRLLQLEESLTGIDLDLPSVLDRAADAVDELLASAVVWLDAAVADLAGPDGTWLLAPAERISSALQGALMFREGPRRAADGCETGDWSHVDVYLTKTLDYRALLFAGSRWDAAAFDWMARRGSTWWTVGAPFPAAGDGQGRAGAGAAGAGAAGAAGAGAARSLRYPGDDDPLVATLVETTIAELLAAHLAANPSDPRSDASP